MSGKVYNNIKTAVFLAVLTGLILIAGQLIGGRTGLFIAIGLAAVTNVVAFFFSDKIALASMGAQEVGPDHELYQITAKLAQRAGLPMPRVYVAPTEAPNAFATGRNPRNAAVSATQGLLDLLDRREVEGVMAHELAHVKHRDILITSVAATIGGAFTYLGYMMWFGGGSRDEDGESSGNPLAGLLVMILGPIAAGLIQAAISRSREYNADTEGAAICGDPMALASALEKLDASSRQIPIEANPAYNSMFIVQPLNAMGTMRELFSTHPATEKRIANLIGRPTTGMYRHAA